jgi:hypothetical protein
VLKWVVPEQPKLFLLGLVDHFNRLGLLDKALEPGGSPRRIGIIDGSDRPGHESVADRLGTY